MNSMLVSSRLDVQVKASEPSAVGDTSAVSKMPNNGFFRGLLISFGIMVPFWGGLIWLGLRLLQLG